MKLPYREAPLLRAESFILNVMFYFCIQTSLASLAVIG